MMPRKKTAQQAGTDASSQPMKKFKSDSAHSSMDEPVARRSLRTRSQDENKVDGNVITGVTKTPPKHIHEVTSSRPKRNALQVTEEKVSVRGAGFAMKTPPKSLNSSKSQTSCPLEVSVQVTPCDLSERMDKATVTEAENSRKRKVKVSPKAEEKKAKLNNATKSQTSSPTASTGQQASISSATTSPTKNCSVRLDSSVSLSASNSLTAFDINKYSGASVGQDGLPSELPTPADDPLFSRPVVRLLGGETAEKSNGTFSVLTYNILAECARTKGDYGYTDSIHLGMDYRGYRIVEEIKHFDCDIVCLQEVDVSYYNDTLAKTLNMLGYDGTFLRRRGDNYPEGEATFYKSSCFKLKEHHEFCYTDLAHQDIDRVEHNDEVKDLLRKHVEREAVLLVTIFTDKQSNRDIVIGNTHIAWTKFVDLALPSMQACYAMKMMDRLSRHGELPFSLCGDFNTRSTDPGYQVTTEGYLNDDSIRVLQNLNNITLPDGSKNSLVNLLWCAFQHPVRDIKSSYYTVQGEEPVCTSRNAVMDHAVDYMWASQLQTTSVTKVNKIEHFMPNIIYPSDHVSLKATYSF